MSSHLVVEGPVGDLECRLDKPDQNAVATAVLCHPHPQYGGSMDDYVLSCAREVMLEAGLNVVRFNFRGVGGSVGVFDEGRGEIEDLLAVLAEVRGRNPELPVCLLGYSFGASVAWNALPTAGELAQLILIAPPTAAMSFTEHAEPVVATAIAGSDDHFVDSRWLAQDGRVIWQVIDGADHFFSGAEDSLKAALRASLSTF